ncbi:unnamed protein product [Eruca vesicaria subsp. sativa]|uniref:Glyceraldehyde 3-phosphate dehydrogenase catalytic domain-containing protein n=1 Tax=Eruca vesicaria subsp. sativa TaxID=29727 RepID=A0ABC8IUP8_ERUVS|nr:unnamed protein product [Eruca vesicaria subsp. sativa]
MCLLQVRQVLGLSTEWPHHPLYFPGRLEVLDGGEDVEQVLVGLLVSIDYALPQHVYAFLQVTKKIFAEEVNTAFTDSTEKELKGIIKVCDEPPVSVDFRCSDVSSPIDSTLTMVMGDDMVKVIVWYDNEWG